MLTLYRRHSRTCKQKDRYYRRCRCAVWVEGTTEDGVYIRRSLKVRSWERGEEIRRRMEARPETGKPQAPISVSKAVAHFLADAEARHLAPATLRKYRTVLGRLVAFCERRALHSVKDISVQHLREFRATWTDSPLTATKKIDRLRSFFRLCSESDWTSMNPAKLVKAPVAKPNPTLPFDREEMARILQCCQTIPLQSRDNGRLYALGLVQRYSGMRISDAAMLTAEKLDGNRLFLYTHKTGVPVYVPLPEFVVAALGELPLLGGEYFFVTGESTRVDTVSDLWRRKLSRVFRAAGIENGHPHRFRDTFAVELLLAGVPIERVSILLGHGSVKITEKHYAPWVIARQEQLEADIIRAWQQDPLRSSLQVA